MPIVDRPDRLELFTFDSIQPGSLVVVCGVTLFDPAKVSAKRYYYRGTKIASP